MYKSIYTSFRQGSKYRDWVSRGLWKLGVGLVEKPGDIALLALIMNMLLVQK